MVSLRRVQLDILASLMGVTIECFSEREGAQINVLYKLRADAG